MKHALRVVVLAVVWGLVAPMSATAEGVTYSVDSTISLTENYSATVRTTINIDATNGRMPPNLTLPAYGQNITALKVSLADNTDVNASVEGNVIKLLTAQAVAGDQTTQTLNISYSTVLVADLGRSYMTMIPPTDYGDLQVVKENLTIRSSEALGTPVSRGLRPIESSQSLGNNVFSWASKDGPIQRPVGLLFGDSSYVAATFAKTLENRSLWWQNISFVLPPDTNQQRVFLHSISPEPTDISLDRDGNVIVSYRLGPRSKRQVEAKLGIAVNSYTYALTGESKVNDIDPLLVERYTSLNDTWADLPEIQVENAEELSVNQLLEQIYTKVASSYEPTQTETMYTIANERSNALIGELRANKIPARLVIGAVFGDGQQVFATPVSHAWVEAYIPDVGWITLDPNFEQYGDYLGFTDVQRVGLSLRSYDPDYPPENLSEFNLSFLDQDIPAVPTMQPDVSATKYMLFPGFSYTSIRVNMPEGVIVDDTGVVVGDAAVQQLGSLAPFQQLNIRTFDVLAAAFVSESVQYGVFPNGVNDDAQILAQATSSTNYVPMIALALLTILAVLLHKFILPRLRDWRAGRTDKLSKRERKRKEPTGKSRHALVIATDKDEEGIENINMLPIDDNPAKPPKPFAVQPQTTNQLAPAPPLQQPPKHEPNHMQVDHAEQVDPVTIEREVKRRRPPLIQ